MAEKQIHELDQATTVSRDDSLVISQAADQRTRRATIGALPLAASVAGQSARPLADKLGETVSVKDFGAKGDGTTDDAAAFQAAVAAGAPRIAIPPGAYRVASTIQIGKDRALIGAGRDAVTIQSDVAGPVFDFDRGAGNLEVNATLSGVSLALPSDGEGVRVFGNGAHLHDIAMWGGAPTGWAIELIDCNVSAISNLLLGPFDHQTLTCSGLYWRNSDPANNAVNYGDGSVSGVHIKLGGAGLVGVRLDGGDAGNLINNLLFADCAIIAPENGTTPFANTVAFDLRRASRCSFVKVDMEAIAKGVVETGLQNGPGANVANSYFGVYALNVGTPYEDNNDTVARAVGQRVFTGCDNFPALPNMADGDVIVPAGFWLQDFVARRNAIRLRSFSGELTIDDGEDQAAIQLLVGGGSPQIQPLQSGGGVNFFVGKSGIRQVVIQPHARFFALNAAPLGADDGALAYADGAGWDPLGDGAPALVFRTGGAWRPLGAPPSLEIAGDAAIAQEAVVTFTGAGASTLTIGGGLPAGGSIAVLNAGSADLTLAAGAGLTLSGGGSVAAGQRASITRFAGDRLDVVVA